jgi:hypothetical protein
LRLINSAVARDGKALCILLLLSGLALLVSGCKLKVYVPTGEGHVESKSGAFYCSVLSVCNIDITNDAFEETFRAVPRPGFVFAGWKDRPMGLYANSIDDAYITTVFHGQSQALLDMLASDEQYYLEPRFIEMEAFEWRPLGKELYGSSEEPIRGVELSADGGVYAVIDRGAAGIPVTVYERGPSRWQRRGDAIGRPGSGSAVDIALSRDGNVLAYSSETADGAGEVAVFSWDGERWQSMGRVIRGEHSGDGAGVPALNADGTVLAVGAPGNADGGASAGHVRVYSWRGSDWVQLGADIDGAAGGRAGSAVDLSANGRVVAIGSPARDGADSDLVGSVGVYAWQGSGWRLRGSRLEGRFSRDGFGNSLALSASGNHLAVGTADIYAKVFVWENGGWATRGYDIESDRAYLQQVDVDISDSGGFLVISEPQYGLQESYSQDGRVRVLIWDGSRWERLGGTFYGNSKCSGGGLCRVDNAGGGRLNADGTVLALTDAGPGQEDHRSGRVRVFYGVD